jgi:hypothetical protein
MHSSAGAGIEELMLEEALFKVKLVDGALDGSSDQAFKPKCLYGDLPTRKIPSFPILPVFADVWLMLGYSPFFIGWNALRCGRSFLPAWTLMLSSP